MNRDYLLRVEGAYPEKLLQRALNQGANFARVQRLGPRILQVAADPVSAGILLNLCKRYGLNAKILRHGGWSAFAQQLKSRWTLTLGMVLCMLLSLGFLSRIWIVDISFTGPRADLGDEAAIRSSIAKDGIFIGMAATSVDADQLQARLMAQAGNYSFVGVRTQGIRLLVEASPEVPAPELYEIERARDLVAGRDGVVVSVTVHSGEACVKPGDTIRRGQTLIRGEEDKTKEETTPVGALGEVIARCWYEGSAEGELQTTVQFPTGRVQESCRLKLMDFSLPITECEGYHSEKIETEILPVVGLFLPLEIERSLHREMQTEERDIDPQQLRAQLAAIARAEALAKLTKEGISYSPADSWEDIQQDQNTLRVRAVYEVYTDIAVTRDALSEEVYATWKTAVK